MMKRFGLGLLSTLAIALIATGWSDKANAQKYPNKPITVIVAWSAGGGSDRSMRLVAATMSKKIGVNVIVVNNHPIPITRLKGMRHIRIDGAVFCQHATDQQTKLAVRARTEPITRIMRTGKKWGWISDTEIVDPERR